MMAFCQLGLHIGTRTRASHMLIEVSREAE